MYYFFKYTVTKYAFRNFWFTGGKINYTIILLAEISNFKYEFLVNQPNCFHLGSNQFCVPENIKYVFISHL